MSSKPSTDDEERARSNVPPAVITDTASREVDDGVAGSSVTGIDVSSQARTPKHANKNKDDETNQHDETLEDVDKSMHSTRPVGHHGWHHQGASSYPSHSYDHRSGAMPYPSREGHSYPPPSHGGQGAGRYFNHHGAAPPSHYGGPPQYDQRYPADQYHRYDHQGGGFPQRPYGPPPPMYPSHQHYSAPSGYDTAGRPSSWGGQYGRPPPHPHANAAGSAEHYSSGHTHSSTSFSRAVSSSFDRSTRSGSREEKMIYHGGHHSGPPMPTHHHQQQEASDNGSVSEDGSWRLLNQVHSVDEDELRKRLQKRDALGESSKEVEVEPPPSNHSSLTNSPTEEVEGKKAPPVPPTSKLTSSLDSLSSVASAQEPMDTKAATSKPLSPSGSSTSLDLMKCASGSSGLLLPTHQRDLSQLSFPGSDNVPTAAGKRPHDEERGDVEDVHKETEDARKEAPGEMRPSKRVRTESKKKSSPLSITCSPPASPNASGEKRKSELKLHQPQPVYPRKDASPNSYYDKAPTYSYSMDSGPPVPRDSSLRGDPYPALPPRPGSASSSTLTPMHVEAGAEMRPVPPGVNQLPSWEIHAQDSFGGASAAGGGHPIMSSFSFQQDYPMIQPASSAEHPGHVMMERGGGHPMLESRNQSFDGGHYHGNFGRTDSMMSYEMRGGPQYESRPPYQGPFPPHAPSWGSASSYPQGLPPPGYNHQYRASYPPMMRNYSEDSGARQSPPPHGPVGMRSLPPGFQPPPEFRAPPSMVAKSGPQNTIMTSPYQPTPKVGPYGWSKEEDSRLTDIMKKYKNPRDWEPIAKEHNRGRTAKECHERWIRYLKPGVRKGQWTDHEDAIVMEVVSASSEQPFTRWSDLAQRLPGRVGKQIRDRWVNHLNPNINHLPFSREDDILLWEGHKKLGKRWVEISTKYFSSNRSENHIKNRWYSASFKKFIANEFGPDAYAGTKSGKKDMKDSPDKKKKTSSSASSVSSAGSPRRRPIDTSSHVEEV